MHNMHQQARSDMKDVSCSHCGCKETELNPDTYETSCAECGMVMENQFTFTHISAKGASGDLEKTGVITNMRNSKLNYDPEAPSALCNNNEYKLKRQTKREINAIVAKLDDYPQIPVAIESALTFWSICYRRNLTRGYQRDTLSAILFYIACRHLDEPLPFLLIDFARILEKNVFKLAKVFYKLCKEIPVTFCVLDDPTIFIQRFVKRLEFGDKSNDIILTAVKLVAQMKEDWISTGRRPSGIYGAAILISARMHGFKRSIKEIVNVVQLSEGTIKKRINEFVDTRVATMRVGDFIQTSKTEIKSNNKEGEKPPVVKQQEKQQIKKQENELKLKNSKNDKNDKKNDDDEDSDDDIIDFLMKPEIDSNTEPVPIEIDESETPTIAPKITQNRINGKKSDKRPMDSSDDEDEDEDDDINNNNNNKNRNKNKHQNVSQLFDDDMEKLKEGANAAHELISSFNQRLGVESDSGYVNSGDGNSSSAVYNNNNHNSSAVETDNYETSYISGAQTRNLNFDDYDEEDLSYLDDDEEIQSMILTDRERQIKERCFNVINPDFEVVKKKSDLRAKAKQEKEERLTRKRRVDELYKDEPHKYIEPKVNKKFRSDKLNIEAFYQLIGDPNHKIKENELSPPITIKPDPLASTET